MKNLLSVDFFTVGRFTRLHTYGFILPSRGLSPGPTPFIKEWNTTYEKKEIYLSPYCVPPPGWWGVLQAR